MATTTYPIAHLISDPEGFFRSAHAERCPFIETDIGLMAIKHSAVRALLHDRQARPAFSRLLAAWGVSSGPFFEWMARSPLDMDGEAHRAWRRLMARTFTPHNVEKLRPRIRAEADALADVLQENGSCEFIGAFARVLPAFGLCELIGVPLEDRPLFSSWADTVGLGFNPGTVAERIGEVDAALLSLLSYAEELVQRRRQTPQDDFISSFIAAVDETAAIEEDLVTATIAGLVFAGHETTKNQLGWMIVVLSELPREWERVAEEPDRAPAIVEELLRFKSTASSVGRVAVDDIEILGRSFAAGAPIIGSLWAANRDPDEFPRPDEFDADDNAQGAHMAFGQGPHHCLGAALARLELQESLVALASKITSLKLEPGSTFLPPVGINGPTSLPISYQARDLTRARD